jgi:hypothetical protein
MTTLTVAINADTQDLAYGTSGVEWVDISLANDYLIFSAGSDTVKDGEAIPSSFQLSQAGVVLTGSDILVAHYFLADISANQLKEATLMGQKNKRYVLAFDFDGITTSEPVLEAWDNSDFDTVDSACLGNGTPSNSWLRGITTTESAPGDSWTGYRLAGSSDGHFLWLNNQNGALSGAQTLYCNLFMIVPAAQTTGGAETPVLVCKYCTT